jgi:lipoate-protein ligase A
MSEKVWRIVDTGVMSAAENMAMDQALLEAKTEYNLPPTLRFLRFKPSAVLVGYNQSIDQEIRLEFCNSHGIDINRRLTGGGAILFDPSQVGWEVYGDKDDPIMPKPLPELYAKLCNCIVAGLKNFGLKAKFRPRNDIEIKGRKISGTGGTELYKAFLFQGTLLVDFDVEQMLKALKIPLEKLKRHEVESARERVTCLKDLLGFVPEYNKIKSAVIDGFKSELGIETEDALLDPREEALFESKLEYFKSQKWIDKVKSPPADKNVISTGLKTEGGILRAAMILDAKGKWLDDIMITGDFFQHPLEIIQNLESVFRDNPLKPDEIITRVREFFREHEFTLLGATEEDAVELITDALNKYRYRELGFTLSEANLIFEINDGIKSLMEKNHKINILTPYCAKQVGCDQRYDKLCDRCDECDAGVMHVMADDLGLHSEGICSFEDLMETLRKYKNEGNIMFVGACCEEFYVRHKRKMAAYGLPGVLIDIDSRTCYELGKAVMAYKGEFENQTYLRLSLINKVMDLIGQNPDLNQSR